MSAGYPGSGTGTPEHSEEATGLKEKAQEMASHLGESAGQMREKAQALASDVAGRAGEAWQSAREGMQERFSSIGHRAEDFWGDATGFIRRYPIASLAVAFGLGCMASCAVAFLARSSTDDVAEGMSRASQ